MMSTPSGWTEEGLRQVAELAVQLHRIDEAAVVALALRYQLSACDPSCLWLATDLECPLATFDDKLAAAARTHLASLP